MKIKDLKKLNEECAVFAVSIDSGEAAGITYNGLLSLQHRGQEGSGIAVLTESNIFCQKNRGLVSEVFSGRTMEKFPKCKIAVGHNRYSTTGTNTTENVQPFVTEYLTGRIATAHNGNIINAIELREKLKKQGLNFKSSSDSEVISSLIAYNCMQKKDVLKGVIAASKELKGAFSLIILSSDNRLYVVRDGSGFRPLCIGENENGIAVASESCALESCGFKFLRDVLPGEVVVINAGKIVFNSIEIEKKISDSGICIFEYIYFARPDSVLDGLSVYKARYNMGKILAKEHPVDADIVCGIPDSGIEAAFGYAAESKIPLVSGFVKNRYIGRSFIFPTQSERENAVRMKLNPLRANVEGKKVVLIDDSIVRGTTSEKIVRAVKSAGAKEVHLRISSPPFRYTCHYGTDIDSEKNLIANKMEIEQIRDKIGADSLGYISIEGLKTACNNIESFCMKCFKYSDNDGLKKDILE